LSATALSSFILRDITFLERLLSSLIFPIAEFSYPASEVLARRGFEKNDVQYNKFRSFPASTGYCSSLANVYNKNLKVQKYVNIFTYSRANASTCVKSLLLQ
jgi:hypothetical protein